MDRETATDPDRRLKGLAERQWRDYQRIEPDTFFGEPGASLTLAEAYDIQAGVAALRCAEGDAVAGYKIGCIGPGEVEQFGMSGPIHARVFRSELRHSGVTLSHRAFANLAIEGEMAVRIGANGAIAAAFPVIELHHFVFRGPHKTLAELVANNGINAGAVIPHHHAGMPLSRWADARTLSVAVNGEMMDSGALWAMEGGPEEALEWLQKNLDRWQEAIGRSDSTLQSVEPPPGVAPPSTGGLVIPHSAATALYRRAARDRRAAVRKAPARQIAPQGKSLCILIAVEHIAYRSQVGSLQTGSCQGIRRKTRHLRQRKRATYRFGMHRCTACTACIKGAPRRPRPLERARHRRQIAPSLACGVRFKNGWNALMSLAFVMSQKTVTL